MVDISFSVMLNIMQYTIFASFISSSAYYMHRFLTTKDERSFYRLKIQKEIMEKRNKLAEKELSTSFQRKIERANLKFINAFRLQIFRMFLVLYLSFTYVITPYIHNEQMNIALLLIILIVIFTEPRFKYSLINVFLDIIINRKKKAKIIELFTLFDMLKTELNTLSDAQEVNVYSTIKNVLPMFDHIQGTLSRFLSLWKRSPKQAKEVFHTEIGGENAKALADILYKLDSVTKNEALQVIEAESNVFSVRYYQKELQQSTKSTTAQFSFFLFTNIFIVMWLIVFVYVMFNDRLGGTNPLF